MLRVTGRHKWPVTRKIFPFDDVIMIYVVLQVWLGAQGCTIDVEVIDAATSRE